jgi:threonine/homoserine/homoserine lactone efflux protein
MVTAAQLTGLVAASVVLIAVPGPSVMFIVGRALALGRRSALATVAGNAVGSLIAAAVVAVGLGRLLQASDTLYHVVKYAGAAYLIYLGVQALRQHRAAAADVHPAEAETSLLRTAAQGVLVGLTNPKVFILYAAVLPQFVVPARGAIATQMLVLSLVPVLIGIVMDSAWALTAGAARTWFARSPNRLRRTGQVGGSCIIALGLVTALAPEK